jgi:hypothetical protein
VVAESDKETLPILKWEEASYNYCKCAMKTQNTDISNCKETMESEDATNR